MDKNIEIIKHIQRTGSVPENISTSYCIGNETKAASQVKIGKYDFTPKGSGFAVGRPLSELQPATLSIDCETIILNKRDLDISFKLESSKIENFDRIIINGITFVRDKTNE